MKLDEVGDPSVKGDLAARSGRTALGQRLDQHALRSGSPLVLQRSATLDNSRDAVGNTKATARQPDPTTEVDALDPPVLPYPQRRPTRHVERLQLVEPIQSGSELRG